jgi:hypothetical protein
MVAPEFENRWGQVSFSSSHTGLYTVMPVDPYDSSEDYGYTIACCSAGSVILSFVLIGQRFSNCGPRTTSGPRGLPL